MNRLNFLSMSCIALCLLFLVASAEENDNASEQDETEFTDLARGWNDKIDWKNLEDGTKIAEESKKPLMILLHKSWCGACKSLKPKFAESDNILELSKDFVMVNIMDDEEPKDKMYTPDGGYIPRILFADATGKVWPEIYNRGGNAQYKYFYSDATQIVTAMIEALNKLRGPKKEMTEEL